MLSNLCHIMPRVYSHVEEIERKQGVTTHGDYYPTWVFPQNWGNTATAFDYSPDGQPVIAGQAIVTRHTVVVEGAYGYHCFVNENYAYSVPSRKAKAMHEELRGQRIMGQKAAMTFLEAEILTNVREN